MTLGTKLKKEREAVAVIPARGGSKRIPRKNIRLFCGKPIVAYSIEAAHQCDLFSAIYVSTEDEEIARISETFGAVVIERPIALADDFTPTIPVIRHAISSLEKKVEYLDAICCIYPTSPFLQASELRSGYEILFHGKWRFVFSATEYAYPIQRAFRIAEDGSVSMFSPEQYYSRTQDLEKSYHDADKFYWGKLSSWKENDRIFDENSAAVLVPSIGAHVIDNEEDWVRAEFMYRAMVDRDNASHYLEAIDEIEQIRSKNNVNWMDVLRLAFRYAPHEASKLMTRINAGDNQISNLMESLTKNPG